MLVASLLVLVSAPTAALAHPFGPPPRAWVTVDGTVVDIVWEASYDDHLAIGERLGYFEPGTSQAYLDPNVQVAPPRSQEENLAASGDLRDYLTDHIVVRQDGRRCEPRVIDTDAFVDRGAHTRHHCPQTAEVLDLRITMLHDIHDAYRTFGLAEEATAGPFAMFSVEEPEHAVTVTELDEGSSTTARLALLGALAVVVIGTVTGFKVITGDRRQV